MTTQMKSVAASMLLLALLGGCVAKTGAATETERELCIQWRDSLPTRSQKDTDRKSVV